MPEIKKGNNSAKNVSELTSFNLCKKTDQALHLYQVSWNLERYQSYRADAVSILKITKGNNSAKK